MNNVTTLTVAQQRLEQQKQAIRDTLNRMKPAMSNVLPKTMTPERMSQIAYVAIRRNPKLLECSPDSIRTSLMTASILGLEPSGPLGHGALIPYKGECQFQVMYQGYLDLARRSGFIRDVQVRPVYAGDAYHFRYGLDPNITHEPLQGAGAENPDRQVIAVYCIIRLIKGGVQWDQMSMGEALAHAKRYSQSWDDRKQEFKAGSVWADNPVAMALKTILKRVLKLCPKSPELGLAMVIDDHAERGDRVSVEKIDDVYDIDVEPAASLASLAPPTEPDRAPLDLAQFRAGTEDNRGHGEEGIDDLHQALEKSLSLPCDVDDFRDIETAAADARVMMKAVADHVMTTMGFTEYGALTKGRKVEVIRWIRAQRRHTS